MKRKRRRELKNATVYTPDQLLKVATRFSELVAQVPSTSTTDLSEMMADLAKKFDPEALASVQKLANAGQLSAGTTINLSVDVTYAPVKKGAAYGTQATVTVSGKPDNVKAAVQAIATRYNVPIAAKLTAALAKQWAQEEEEKKREPAAPGPRGGSFNFRQLNFTL